MTLTSVAVGSSFRTSVTMLPSSRVLRRPCLAWPPRVADWAPWQRRCPVYLRRLGRRTSGCILVGRPCHPGWAGCRDEAAVDDGSSERSQEPPAALGGVNAKRLPRLGRCGIGGRLDVVVLGVAGRGEPVGVVQPRACSCSRPACHSCTSKPRPTRSTSSSHSPAATLSRWASTGVTPRTVRTAISPSPRCSRRTVAACQSRLCTSAGQFSAWLAADSGRPAACAASAAATTSAVASSTFPSLLAVRCRSAAGGGVG
jgi:hypothetical protein